MSDSLATLRSALAPKTGMRRIPFPTESYQHPSLPLSDKKLLNFYSEAAPSDARTTVALRSSAGLSVYKTFATGPIRALNDDLPGYIYVASGNHLYRIANFAADPNGVVTDLGAIGDPSGAADAVLFVSIAVGPTGVVACVPPNAYGCTHADTAVNQLGGTFPGDAGSVAYFDGYFVFTQQSNNQQFFISRLLDLTLFDALDFASSTEEFPNATLKVQTVGAQVWFIGYSGMEPWYNSGDADFPLRRLQGVVLERGVATPKCTAIADGSLFWVTVDGIALRSVGYKPQRISTHAIEDVIRLLGAGLIVSGMAYTQGGHVVYVISWANRTLAYDVTTQTWHDKSSSSDGSSRWLPGTACVHTPTPIVGSSVAGVLYKVDPDTGADDGVSVQRQIIFPPIYGGTNRAFCNRLEIEMEVGTQRSNGLFVLDWSDDGGTTWKTPRTLSAGDVGAIRQRVYTTRLGSFHQRVFRLTFQGQLPVIYAVDADITGPPTTSGG